MHLLLAGQATQRYRTTANAIVHVAAGTGHRILNGQRFDWQFGDTFCVPTWCWQEHHAASSGDAILFQATDAPALQALALLREETAS